MPASRPGPEQGVPFFMHVPKTAGMSMYRLLSRHFAREQIHPIPMPPESTWQQDLPVRPFRDLATAHQEFDAEGAKRYGLVMGHYDHGICERAPWLLPFTFLRDPVARVVSAYRHAARTADTWSRYLHEKIAQGMTIRGMGSDPDIVAAVRRSQAEQVGGFLWSRRPESIADGPLLATAMANLSRFSCVGVTEHLEASVLLLLHALQLPPIGELPRENVAPEAAAPIDDDLERDIRGTCQVDVALYEAAEARFRSDWQSLVLELLGGDEPAGPSYRDAEVRRRVRERLALRYGGDGAAS